MATSDDAQDPDGQALHLSGDANERGVDTYWHMGAALDQIYARVRFRAKTERALAASNLRGNWAEP